ncbi:MAG: DUF6527 family protein [Planctomycetota bacterium]|jgi:hypothetical protein
MKTISHKFVELIPDHLENGIIYISLMYGTAIHKCFCGCENEVVTPLSPTDWILIFDGKSISLHPSIGNWSLACRSHYWIENNKVEWARELSEVEVKAGRQQDYLRKRKYYAGIGVSSDRGRNIIGEASEKDRLDIKDGLSIRVKKWWFRFITT